MCGKGVLTSLRRSCCNVNKQKLCLIAAPCYVPRLSPATGNRWFLAIDRACCAPVDPNAPDDLGGVVRRFYVGRGDQSAESGWDRDRRSDSSRIAAGDSRRWLLVPGWHCDPSLLRLSPSAWLDTVPALQRGDVGLARWLGTGGSLRDGPLGAPWRRIQDRSTGYLDRSHDR